MNKALKRLILTALMGLVMGPATADDTDIFYGGGGGDSDAPIVMFSLDYRPNLGSTATCGSAESCQRLIAEGNLNPTGPYSFFDILRAALRVVMEPLDGVKIGLFLNHANENNCANKVVAGCSNGGYIALGARTFMADDANGAKEAFHAFLEAMPTPAGNESHPYQGKELFFELYRYLIGAGIYNGHVGFADYLDHPSHNKTNLDVYKPEISWDTTVEQGNDYISPLMGGGQCTKLFTVNVMFQVSQQEDHSDNEIRKSSVQGGMGLNNPTFPDVIKWLNDADLASGQYGTVPDFDGKQNVTSYFIVDPTSINTKTRGYATAGGTGVPLALSQNPDELIESLSQIFDQILSVSTTFVAASVPSNVFNRAEVVDNVFISLFQPDDNVQPYWTGNVKKLRIEGLNTNSARIVDALGQLATTADDQIRFDALTYWSDPSTLPPADTSKNEVDNRDGRFAYRGGAGQRIPGFVSGSPGFTNADGGRTLFYDDGDALAALNADSSTASALQSDLGAASSAEAETLLAWARGLDIDDLDDNGVVDEPRPWIFGDPLHSRPLPLNYGAWGGYTRENPAIFILVGSNDGFLRMIRNTTTGGTQSGQEMWAFMPRSVMGKLHILRDNVPNVKHPYLVDDSPVSYVRDVNNDGTISGAGEKAWVFFGLRRGGKALYGLDVTDPENPELLWTPIEKGGDFAELGHTFSTPRVIRIADGSGGVKPALIFAGGYDTNKDDRSGPGTDDSEGNAVFVVDAETGELIWKAVGGSGTASAKVFYHDDFRDSVPAPVAAFDSNGNGEDDRVYFGDSGGNVWRVDMVGSDTTDWKLTRLAALGRHGADASGKASDRRFFHRVDVVQHLDSAGAYDAVILGSGDREDPKDFGGITQNRAYMIKDRNVTPGSGTNEDLQNSDLGDVTNTCLTRDGECTADLDSGWRFDLSSREKFLSTPLTISRTIWFTTYLPAGATTSQGSCGPNEGSGRTYSVGLTDASAQTNFDTTTAEDDRFYERAAPGMPADPVALPPNKIMDGLKINETNATTRFRTYWYEAEDSEP